MAMENSVWQFIIHALILDFLTYCLPNRRCCYFFAKNFSFPVLFVQLENFLLTLFFSLGRKQGREGQTSRFMPSSEDIFEGPLDNS